MPRSRKPRTTISLTEQQKAWLAKETARLGVYESEVVRHALDVARGARPLGSTPTKGATLADSEAPDSEAPEGQT